VKNRGPYECPAHQCPFATAIATHSIATHPASDRSSIVRRREDALTTKAASDSRKIGENTNRPRLGLIRSPTSASPMNAFDA